MAKASAATKQEQTTAEVVNTDGVKLQTTSISSEKDFGKTLLKAKQSVGDGFMMLQDAILYGLQHYAKHSGDGSLLGRAMAACNELSGTNPNQLKAYIQSYANVRLREVGDGTMQFTKTGKGKPLVNMPAEGDYWWNHKEERITLRADLFDPIGELEKLLKRAENKMKDGKIPQDRMPLVAEIRQRLQDLINEHPALEKKELFSSSNTGSDSEQSEDESKAA